MAVALVSLLDIFCFTSDRTKDVLRWTSRVVLLPAGRGAALTGRNRPQNSAKKVWILDFGDFGFWILDFGDFGFWDFGVFGFWIVGILAFGILGILDFGDFGFWIVGILDCGDFGF